MYPYAFLEWGVIPLGPPGTPVGPGPPARARPKRPSEIATQSPPKLQFLQNGVVFGILPRIPKNGLVKSWPDRPHMAEHRSD